VVAYKSTKTKEKSILGNPNSGRGRLGGSGRLGELFITKFKSQFKWGFAKVVVTRAGRLQEWSQLTLNDSVFVHYAGTMNK